MFKGVLFFSVFITFAVIALITFNVYHNISTSTISQDTNIQILPITPSFDKETLELLKKRSQISVDLKKTINIKPTITTTPSEAPVTIDIENLENEENPIEEATVSSEINIE